ncbi:hypothetical protein EZS27_035530 [termite gut metagenome]|uniref:Integrase catalytic domain-containing protein n=1 Tax=termite gut metagenome TaxID=433724 RepID=A0A5J4PYL5_9ZZZZ
MGKVSIEQRPEIINQKQRFGDWEIDTIVGKENKGAILTVTERKTGFLLMKKLPKGKNAKALAKELFSLLLPYKEHVLSITSDNGTEFYEHKWIAQKLDTDYFFAHPYSSWERGLNEYTNKLIRQYIPKKEVFTNYTDKQILDIQHKLNRRPRKLLNFEEPFSMFYKMINYKVAFNTRIYACPYIRRIPTHQKQKKNVFSKSPAKKIQSRESCLIYTRHYTD